MKERRDRLKYRTHGEVKAYYDGTANGLKLYAWWKDGEQYVGSCGTTLRDALEYVEECKAVAMQDIKTVIELQNNNMEN